MSNNKQKPSTSLFVQMIVGFVIPTVILFTLSDASRLGPLVAMFVALAFPVALELYGLSRKRKPSFVSIAAIIGILLIGVITVLQLGEEWLAVRRSFIYIVAALGLLFVLKFKPHLVDVGLERLLDMSQVRATAKAKKTEHLLAHHVARAGYILAVLLLAIGIAAYVLTIVMINSPAGSSQFNAEYAELRIMSIPVLTVPLLIGMVALLVYLTTAFEKATGIEMEQMLKKKK